MRRFEFPRRLFPFFRFDAFLSEFRQRELSVVQSLFGSVVLEGCRWSMGTIPARLRSLSWISALRKAPQKKVSARPARRIGEWRRGASCQPNRRLATSGRRDVQERPCTSPFRKKKGRGRLSAFPLQLLLLSFLKKKQNHSSAHLSNERQSKMYRGTR